eukprot:3460739-Alexandrium_andersonii.AAC.1
MPILPPSVGEGSATCALQGGHELSHGGTALERRARPRRAAGEGNGATDMLKVNQHFQPGPRTHVGAWGATHKMQGSQVITYTK